MKSSEKYDLILNPKVFPILSLNKFSRLIGVPRKKIEQLVENVEVFYSPFSEKDSDRIIDNPTGFLKKIQGLIFRRILSHVLFPNFIIGGVKGRNPFEHPKLHIRKPVVVTIDVKDCYPSISNKRIFSVWFNQLNSSADVARLATKLTTVKGHLPLGSPTSSYLANLVLFPCVKNAIMIADKHNFTSSNYCDDSAFSGEKLPDEFITLIIREFSRRGLRIGRRKICVMRSGGSQYVARKKVNKKLALYKHKP